MYTVCIYIYIYILRSIRKLGISASEFPGGSPQTWEVPPPRIKHLLEAGPHKARLATNLFVFVCFACLLFVIGLLLTCVVLGPASGQDRSIAPGGSQY